MPARCSRPLAGNFLSNLAPGRLCVFPRLQLFRSDHCEHSQHSRPPLSRPIRLRTTGAVSFRSRARPTLGGNQASMEMTSRADHSHLRGGVGGGEKKATRSASLFRDCCKKSQSTRSAVRASFSAPRPAVCLSRARLIDTRYDHAPTWPIQPKEAAAHTSLELVLRRPETRCSHSRSEPDGGRRRNPRANCPAKVPVGPPRGRAQFAQGAALDIHSFIVFGPSCRAKESALSCLSSSWRALATERGRCFTHDDGAGYDNLIGPFVSLPNW